MKHSRENFYKFGLSLFIIAAATISFQISVIGIAENLFALSTVTSIVDAQSNTLSGMEYDPKHKAMYVANFGSNTVSVINTNTSTPMGNPIKVGIGPKEIVHDPEHQRMYVTNFGSNTVTAIDTNTNKPGSAITVGSGPVDIAYDPVHHRMYTANLDNDSLSIIDTNTNAVVGNPIKLGMSPKAIEYNANNQKMYIVNFGTKGMISVLDTNTNAFTHSHIEIGNIPQKIEYDPTNHRMYITNFGSNTVSVIGSNSTGAENNALSIDAPNNLAFDRANQRLYVASSSGQINIVDTKTKSVLEDPIQIDGIPQEIAYDPFDERLYVAIDNSSSITVLDLISLNTTITSAVDGLGYGIKNETISDSNKISIRFNETDTPQHKVQGYECSLDSSSFVPCSNPTIYDNLEPGNKHIFRVKSVDVYGNMEQSPASLVWNVNKTSQLVPGSLGASCGEGIDRNKAIRDIQTRSNNIPENLGLDNRQISSCSDINTETNWKVPYPGDVGKFDGNGAVGPNDEPGWQNGISSNFNCNIIDRTINSIPLSNEGGNCDPEADSEDHTRDVRSPQMSSPQFSQKDNTTMQNVPLALPF